MIEAGIERTMARAFDTMARGSAIRAASYGTTGGGRGTVAGMNAMERHAEAALVLKRAKTALSADEFAWATLACDEGGGGFYEAVSTLADAFRSAHKNRDFVWDLISWEFGGSGTLASIAERHGRGMTTAKTVAGRVRVAVAELRARALAKLNEAFSTRH